MTLFNILLLLQDTSCRLRRRGSTTRLVSGCHWVWCDRTDESATPRKSWRVGACGHRNLWLNLHAL